jgi:hypothetical protein
MSEDVRVLQGCCKGISRICVPCCACVLVIQHIDVVIPLHHHEKTLQQLRPDLRVLQECYRSDTGVLQRCYRDVTSVMIIK